MRNPHPIQGRQSRYIFKNADPACLKHNLIVRLGAIPRNRQRSQCARKLAGLPWYVNRIGPHATTDWPPYRIAALGLGYVPEGRRIFANLTVDENLRVPIERAGPWTIARVYKLFPRLAQRKANKGRQLSGGEQEMLAIARALLLNPKILVLDEPSQGLAPLIVQEVFRVVTSMRQEGISVLLVEQNVRAAVEIADRAYVLDDGRVVFAGVAAEFAKDEARVRALAGASAEEWAPPSARA